MDESKVGGLGSEDMEAKDAGGEKPTELPPDLEQEKREIETRIEQHIAKLQEIAEVFGIDSSQFSEEDDGNLLELADSLSKNPSSQRGGYLFDRFDYQEKGRQKSLMGVKSSTANLIDMAREASESGILQSVEGNSLMEVDYPLFDQEESRAARDFPYTEVLWKLHEDLSILELKKLNDSDFEEMLNFIDSRRKIDPDEQLPLRNNLALFYQKKGFSEEERNNFHRKIKAKISDFDYPQSFRNLELLLARIQAHICVITIQRYWYMDELARSGHKSFTEDPEKSSDDKKYFNVDHNFQFTEEDARKARELNLPWSRIEKEKERK